VAPQHGAPALIELNRFGKWLVQRGYLKANPLAEVVIPKRPHLLPSVVEWSVVDRAVAAERQPRARAILALLAYAALRRGEVMASNVEDYSRDVQSLRARQGKQRPCPANSVTSRGGA